MNRKKMIIIYGLVYFVLVMGLIYILNEKKKTFSIASLNEMINNSSTIMPKTSDLCQVQLLGEPKVGKEYVKVNIYCLNGSKAMSTLALGAFSDKSIFGVLEEYGKIVNFNDKISNNESWKCKVNGQEINNKNGNNLIQEAATIDCFQTK